jgi:hypothetical protein
MDWSFLLYVLLTIIFLLGVTYNSLVNGKPITASILFIGILAAIIYFGVLWFTTYGDVKNEGGAWPPDGSINVCPDFFSLGKSSSTNKYVCKDMHGVTGMPGDFDLKTDMSGKARVQALCDECSTSAPNGGTVITWEGVYDGTSCVGLNRAIPIPPSS